MKKTAFTLIELLVVVAIIGILASLAIPAYTKIMEKGRAVQDANNLKQLGLGIAAYTNDNSDSYFVSGSTAWPLLLNGTSGTQYIPVWKVFQSPFDKRAASETGATAPASPVSYAFNKNLLGISTGDVASSSSCIVLGVLMASPSIPPNFGTGDLTAASPADKLSALDSTSNKISGKTVGTFSGGVWLNVLFADSHVAQLKASSMDTSAGKSGTINDIRWNK